MATDRNRGTEAIYSEPSTTNDYSIGKNIFIEKARFYFEEFPDLSVHIPSDHELASSYLRRLLPFSQRKETLLYEL